MITLRHALVVALCLGGVHSSEGQAEADVRTGIYRCSLPRERKEGSLVVNPDATCIRHITRLAGASNSYCPGDVCASCLSLSESLECLMLSPAGVPLSLPAGATIYDCTLAGGTLPGSLLVRPDRSCARYNRSLVGSSREYCPDGVCPACSALSRDIGCVPSE